MLSARSSSSSAWPSGTAGSASARRRSCKRPPRTSPVLPLLNSSWTAARPSFRPFDGPNAPALRALWHRVHDEFAADCEWRESDRPLPADRIAALLPSAQREVSRCIADRAGCAFLAAFDVDDVAEGQRAAARMRSCRGAAASAWLEAKPGATTTLGDTAFVLAGRHRLGLGAPTAVEAAPCPCAAGCAGTPDHAMLCKSVASMTTMRHDIEALAVRRVISRAGCASSMEPTYRHLHSRGQHAGPEGQRRGDILTVLPDGRVIIVDIVVTHPAAPTYARAAARTDGAAAERAANQKRAEFRSFADGAQYEFVPFAVESFGRLGQDAQRFINTLGDVAAAGGRVSKSVFVMNAYKDLSCTLQRGNGLMYSRSLFNIARAEGRQFLLGSDVPLQDAAAL